MQIYYTLFIYTYVCHICTHLCVYFLDTHTLVLSRKTWCGRVTFEKYWWQSFFTTLFFLRLLLLLFHVTCVPLFPSVCCFKMYETPSSRGAKIRRLGKENCPSLETHGKILVTDEEPSSRPVSTVCLDHVILGPVVSPRVWILQTRTWGVITSEMFTILSHYIAFMRTGLTYMTN